MKEKRPSQEEFFAQPIEDISKIAPDTMVLSIGGTRRSAALAGISIQDEEFAHWSRQHMIAGFDLIFRHGVRHLFTHALIPSQFKEVGFYRKKLMEWVKWGVAPETLADYARLGWRVRILGAESVPELYELEQRLRTLTPKQSPHTLWWLVIPHADTPWELVLTAAQRAQAKSRQEAIRALYGEDIPPATLLLSFGKPVVSTTLIPPLLAGHVHCYWTQRPGYRLSEQILREILYDYAYQRPTWRADKTGRAEEAVAHREAWENGPTIGLGMRLGSFWYPAPILPSPTR